MSPTIDKPCNERISELTINNTSEDAILLFGIMSYMISLPKFCADACTEPTLQLLSREPLTYATANIEDGVHLDISAAGFWGSNHQKAFFNVKCLN